MTDAFSAPMRSSAPSGSPTSYNDPKKIDALLKSSDPQAVAEAGRSYQKFASAYEKIAADLLSIRTDLHEAWSGMDAAAAQSQLREVWAAATTVHKTAGAFGVAVERHGSESLAWYKNNKPASTSLAEARSWMTGANERVAQSWGSLPQNLSTTLPPGKAKSDFGLPGSGGGREGGGLSGSPSPSGGAGGHGGASGSFKQFPGGHHSGAEGSQSRLAGLVPEGGNGMFNPGSGTGIMPGAGDGLFPGGFNPDSAAGGMNSSGGFVPGSGLFGSSGAVSGGLGSVGGSEVGERMSGLPMGARQVTEEAQAAETGAAAGVGTSGPMVGGAGGADRRERERTRQTWLAEDEDVWNGDIQSTPHLIGSAPGGVTKVPEPAAESVEIDLSSDGDALEDLLAELGELGDPDGDGKKDTATEIAELRAKLERLESQAAAERQIVVTGDAPDWIPGDDG